jgi:L,D-transpeptidase catalytic domain
MSTPSLPAPNVFPGPKLPFNRLSARFSKAGAFSVICRFKACENVGDAVRYLMRHLATIFIVLIAAPIWANDRDALLQQAEALGAPVAAVRRAIAISHQPIFAKKDVLAVFDISQPSKNKRFYVLDFKSGQVTAHYAAHGRHNGPGAKATKFKGFQTDLDMVPLGPLRTLHSMELDPYKTIVDHYDGTVYRNMIVVVLEGVTAYNSYINNNRPFAWVIHPNWYATAAFRAKNNGGLGRSDGCIVLDPAENNALITRLEDGALVYVTVGDAPIEQFL